MEGRTIVRPNAITVKVTEFITPAFNGGPDNCPAEHPVWVLWRHWITPFNGGPDNCPAEPAYGGGHRAQHHQPSMEGRTIVRPNFEALWLAAKVTWDLQWRAGQLSGRTGFARDTTNSSNNYLQWRAGQLSGRTLAGAVPVTTRCCSFNGGPDNCPAEPRLRFGRLLAGRVPFNGGPDNCPAEPARWRGFRRRGLAPFNGGPDNCPAEPSCCVTGAGMCASFNGGPDNCPAELDLVRDGETTGASPSMEGRTIVRPNPNGSWVVITSGDGLQWRAGQLSGRTGDDGALVSALPALQWRAGQLSGRTHVDEAQPRPVDSLQWRAGQLSGRTVGAEQESQRHRVGLQWRAGQLSGRTYTDSKGIDKAGNLQWRAGQLSGRTCARRSASSSHRRTFNGGPDNCPAELDVKQ